MPTTLPPAKAVIKAVLGCVDSDDATHLIFSAAKGIPIQESTTETPDDPANGALFEGASSLFSHGGKMYQRTADGVAKVVSILPETAIIADPVASMSVGRKAHSVTLLGNGKILIAGGVNYDYTATYSSCFLFDPSTGVITSTGALSTARFGHAAIRLGNGKVLVAGGDDTDFVDLASCELYDPEAGTWAAAGTLNNARRNCDIFLQDDGTVIIIGGDGVSVCEIYTPGSDSWATTGSLAKNRDRQQCSAMLPDGRILIAGGATSGGVNLVQCEIYDPETGIWTVTGSLSTGRQVHTVTAMADGRVLAAGGTDSENNPLKSCEIYDGGTGLWTATSDLAAERSFHSAILVSDGVQVIGGRDFDGITIGTCEKFNTALQWISTVALNYVRAEAALALLATGQIFVSGGWTSDSVVLASNEIYGTKLQPSSDLSDYVTLDTTQTISGNKTFTGDVTGINQPNLVTTDTTQTITAAKTFSAKPVASDGLTVGSLAQNTVVPDIDGEDTYPFTATGSGQILSVRLDLFSDYNMSLHFDLYTEADELLGGYDVEKPNDGLTHVIYPMTDVINLVAGTNYKVAVSGTDVAHITTVTLFVPDIEPDATAGKSTFYSDADFKGTVTFSGASATFSGAVEFSNGISMFGGIAGQWAPIADPTGGAVVDAECRAQLASLLSALRSRGDMET